jgi:hypothetical protein
MRFKHDDARTCLRCCQDVKNVTSWQICLEGKWKPHPVSKYRQISQRRCGLSSTMCAHACNVARTWKTLPHGKFVWKGNGSRTLCLKIGRFSKDDAVQARRRGSSTTMRAHACDVARTWKPLPRVYLYISTVAHYCQWISYLPFNEFPWVKWSLDMCSGIS